MPLIQGSPPPKKKTGIENYKKKTLEAWSAAARSPNHPARPCYTLSCAFTTRKQRQSGPFLHHGSNQHNAQQTNKQTNKVTIRSLFSIVGNLTRLVKKVNSVAHSMHASAYKKTQTRHADNGETEAYMTKAQSHTLRYTSSSSDSESGVLLSRRMKSRGAQN